MSVVRTAAVGAAITVGLLVYVAAASAQPVPVPPQVEAGLGEGVTIRSADNSASMNLRVRIQVRATALEGAGEELPEQTETSIRRLRLVFQGNAAGPALTYYIQLSFSNLDNEVDLRLPLRDAYVTIQPSPSLGIRVGQMKVPFSRQRVVSSSALQMVDRSIVVSELNLDRDVGVQIFSRRLFGTEKVGFAAGVFGGEGRNRLGRAAGLLYTARVESWPFGAFDDLAEGDLQRVRRLRVALGTSVGYNHNTNRPRSTIGLPYPAGDFDYAHAGVDTAVKIRGWSLTTEALYRRADGDQQVVLVGGAPVRIVSRSGWGGYIQGGRMMTPRLEISARYSRRLPRDGTDPTLLRAEEVGAGASYYLRGHDLKVQADVFRGTDPTLGLEAWQARTQFQLFF